MPFPDILHHDAACKYRSNISCHCQRHKNKAEEPTEDEDGLPLSTDVPAEVLDWIATTFTRKLEAGRRKAISETPKFRTVKLTILPGKFSDRTYKSELTTHSLKFAPEVVSLLKTLDTWSFDTFELADLSGQRPIMYLGYDLLNRYGVAQKFEVPDDALINFLNRIEEGYCKYDNPYHNNLHGADVTQTMHYMLCQTGLMNWLSDLEIFATIIAAIIHDFEHTGTNNNFHIMAKSEIALVYNDRAVLENHHISATFRILQEEECNILINMTREEYFEFRNLVINLVFATDMSVHFQMHKNMRMTLSQEDPVIDKGTALGMILHACDISHPAKHWDIHLRWTNRLLEEFFRQGDQEAELDIPFSPLCDRDNTHVAESQIGFIEFIVDPSMKLCGDMLDKIRQSYTEDQTSSSSNIITHDESPNFHVKRPWVVYLVQNKTAWRDRAATETERRFSGDTTDAVPKKLEVVHDSALSMDQKRDESFDGTDKFKK